jgi:hypothetical protein
MVVTVLGAVIASSIKPPADWADTWVPVVGAIIALLLWEFVFRPLRHYVWTFPEEAHLNQLADADSAKSEHERKIAKVNSKLETYRRANEGLLAQLERIKHGTPRLVCTNQKWVPCFVGEPRRYWFHALSVWISNEPQIRTPDSSAVRVSVRVEFYAAGASAPFIALTSQWTKSRDPEAAGFVGYEPATDIAANDVPAKFVLLVQHPSTDDDCFAFSVGALDGHPDARFERHRIRPGRYGLRFLLRGNNVEQVIEATLVHHGRQRPPELLDVPKKHDEAEPSPAGAD